MKERMILLIGESGSGKRALIDAMCARYEYKELLPYTDRPRREGENDGFTFVSAEEFDNIKRCETTDAYAEYDGYRYMITHTQSETADICIIGPRLLEDLTSRGTAAVDLCTVYTAVPKALRTERMKRSGKSAAEIGSVVAYEEKLFDLTVCVTFELHTTFTRLNIQIIRLWTRFTEFQKRCPLFFSEVCCQ